jgi:uncharacterized damage-inducible protein DinB
MLVASSFIKWPPHKVYRESSVWHVPSPPQLCSAERTLICGETATQFIQSGMAQVPRWFDRKFEFSFPQELYPNVCIRLRGTPARLEELIRNSSREELIRKPEGKWSAQEHAGHVFDVESLWLARVHDFTSGCGELTVADLSNRKTDEANHNARPADEILSDFRNARLHLVDSVQELDPAAFGQTMLHPRLKTPMRLIDHLFFAAEHDDHHLAWIWQLLRDQKSK